MDSWFLWEGVFGLPHTKWGGNAVPVMLKRVTAKFSNLYKQVNTCLSDGGHPRRVWYSYYSIRHKRPLSYSLSMGDGLCMATKHCPSTQRTGPKKNTLHHSNRKQQQIWNAVQRLNTKPLQSTVYYN